MAPLGKSLIAIGVLLALIGLVLWVGAGIPLLNRLGRSPGDIYLRRDGFTLYFPLTTAIIISVILSLLLAWLRR
jgi:formate hydrogenlyase subunit 3/multisubunit Na+/H+ antiporter MnhD subunit